MGRGACAPTCQSATRAGTSRSRTRWLQQAKPPAGRCDNPWVQSAGTSFRARIVAMHNLAIDAVTSEVVQAFDAAGVKSLLLKGPTIARWLYTDNTPRPYGDTDLLVPPHQFARAAEVLDALGFANEWAGVRESERNRHADMYVRHQRQGAFTVDLHHRIELTKVPPAQAWAVLEAHASTTPFAGNAVACLDRAARCVLLALHVAHHGYAEAKPLEDLRRGRSLETRSTWAEARAVADQLGATVAFDLGLALLEETPESLVNSAAWSAADTDLRMSVLNLPPPAQLLLMMNELPLYRRPGFALGRLFASPARLRTKQGRQAPIPSLYWRQVRELAAMLPAGVTEARRFRRLSGQGYPDR